MLIGELPELEETQSGKDLIAIGEKRATVAVAEARFGKLSAQTKAQINSLGASNVKALLELLGRVSEMSVFTEWLDSHSTDK